MFSAPAPKNTLRSGTGTVTISGLNFGAYSFTPTATHSGDILCGTASWTSGTTVACSPSAFTTQASATRARVTVSAVVGTRSVIGFTFDGNDSGASGCGGVERGPAMDGGLQGSTCDASQKACLVGCKGVDKQTDGMCDWESGEG